MSQIFWLASYPKSGNTWLRVFMANFQRDDAQPVDINAMKVGTVASDRGAFDGALGLESSDMTADEIECCRPDAWRHLAARSAKTLYVKVHDAWVLTSGGEPLIPVDATRGAIYVTRNPLDVAISFAHHLSIPLDEAIECLARETMALSESPRRLRIQFRQRLLSWSGHVLSWLDQRAIPLHVMRYEDMSFRPVETFSAAVRFLGWVDDVDRVRRSVAFSAFDALQRQEQAHGFRERTTLSPFFRHGQAGAWRDILTRDQVARIVRDHAAVMRRLGYLSESGLIELPQ